MLTEADKKKMVDAIQSNKHELFVVDVGEMDFIMRSNHNGQKLTPEGYEIWKNISAHLLFGANVGSTIDTGVLTGKLLAQLGGFGTSVIIRHYNHKPFFIIKGNPNLRSILTGTRYGMKNPKVVSLGLGRYGALNAIKSSGILSLVLITTYRVFDYVMTDDATLTQLIGRLATDIMKIGIVTIASIGAALVVAAATTAWGFFIGIGPLVAVLVVSSIATIVLELLDNHYGISEKVVAELEKFNLKAEEYFKNKKQDIVNATDMALNAISGNTLELIPEWK